METKKYYFSPPVKGEFFLAGGEEAGVYLRVYDDYTNRTVGESEHVTSTEGYIRLSVPFSTASERSVRLELHQKGAGGAYACGVQLEKGACAGPFNMLGRMDHASDMGNRAFSDGAEQYGYDTSDRPREGALAYNFARF